MRIKKERGSPASAVRAGAGDRDSIAVANMVGSAAKGSGGPAAAVPFATHRERRRANAERRAAQLFSALPSSWWAAASGDPAASSALGHTVVEQQLVQLVISKGGPEGDATRGGWRAWNALAGFAASGGLDQPLPASAALVARVVCLQLAQASWACPPDDAVGVVSETRFSQGVGRRGGRQKQLAVRWKLISVVRSALQRFGRLWLELPPGTGDWQVLPHAYGEGV